MFTTTRLAKLLFVESKPRNQTFCPGLRWHEVGQLSGSSTFLAPVRGINKLETPLCNTLSSRRVPEEDCSRDASAVTTYRSFAKPWAPM